MRHCVIGSLLLLISSACAQQSSTDSPAANINTPTAPGTLVSGGLAAIRLNAGTHLSGDHENPPRDTLAQGQAIFQLNPAGTVLSYRLIASNIENVVAAHIHLGAPDVNGGIVVFLYGNAPPAGGRTDGVLATGTITGANLINDLAGQPLSALISHIEAGNAYVNVHTNDGVAPTNTGPGDFPGGEIRGQLP